MQEDGVAYVRQCIMALLMVEMSGEREMALDGLFNHRDCDEHTSSILF